MDTTIDTEIAQLREYRAKHMELGKRITHAGSAWYALDFLVIATLNRSLMLTMGFCTLMEARNFISAAPLIRLQLDTCLRFSAATLVQDTHAFALKIMRGEQINKQKDRNGNLMTDRYLVNNLAQYAPWVSSVYEHTSGYVHLSEKHIFNAIQAGAEEGAFIATINDRDRFVPDSLYKEAIEAFKAITSLLFEYLDQWAEEKIKHSPTPENAATEDKG